MPFGGFIGLLAGEVYSISKLGLSDLLRTDSKVYLGVKFRYGYKLNTDYIKEKEILAGVCYVLRNNVISYENVLLIF